MSPTDLRRNVGSAANNQDAAKADTRLRFLKILLGTKPPCTTNSHPPSWSRLPPCTYVSEAGYNDFAGPCAIDSPAPSGLRLTSLLPVTGAAGTAAAPSS